jgi:beta-N-acetylhexosaminidase
MQRQAHINAGQTLVVGFADQEPPRALLAAAGRGEIGGFILFSRNLGGLSDVVDLNRRLTKAAPAAYPPWVTLDQEGGRVARLGPPVVILPSMRALASLARPDLTRDAAVLLGQQLKSLGFNLNLAPVVDVDTNPDNPIIGDRSFSSDPAVVAAHGQAFILGLQTAGVAACAKHFPGHGDTSLDSHLDLPKVAHDRKRLNHVELVPYRAVIEDVLSIMTAHVVYETIDPRMPASLSRPVITGLLREQLGYRGVIISDAMEMKAISDHFGVEDAACLAIEAGCDALLLCQGPEQALSAFEALVHRAERNAEFSALLAQAAARSIATRKKLVAVLRQSEERFDPEVFRAQSRSFEFQIELAKSSGATSSE